MNFNMIFLPLKYYEVLNEKKIIEKISTLKNSSAQNIKIINETIFDCKGILKTKSNNFLRKLLFNEKSNDKTEE